MPDPTEILTDWKAKTDAATEGPWCTKEHRNETGDWESTDLIHDYVTPSGQTWRDQVLGYVDLDEADADFIATARTAMPRLLAAVESVLGLHTPFEAEGVRPPACKACIYPHPCPTVRAITDALGGGDDE